MIKVGVIGLGNMGRHHARIYAQTDGAELVAAADVREEAEDVARRYGARFYRDYREMLERERPDAISVAVPTGFHRDVGTECIRAGVATLIEKPLAASVEEARELVKLAESLDVPLMVGHIERFNPAVRALKDLIDHGDLGGLTSLTARRVGVFPPQVKDADVILDLAVHDIDLCSFLFGRLPERVYARAGKALNSRRWDFAGIFLDYGGAVALLQANWITPVKIRELTVTGTGGYAELDYITQKLRVYESNYQRTFDSFGDFVVKFGSPRVREVPVEGAEPLYLELSHFVSCVARGEPPEVSGREGLLAVTVATEAARSCEEGQVVEVGICPG
ncbi:MAG TPA: Gfo/Idh/MocA family oxidoreductase [Candidatus Latescibacteria bacterium]|nr:Gfo/Idh/MocA family oxidoreductase [Candidatus Latescibacterota bacterium]